MQFADRYGRFALIAGASVGLGGAFAAEAAARGLDLLLVARRGGALDETAERLRRLHRREVRTLALDLARPDAADRIAEGAAGLEIGLLLFNAAAEPQGHFLDLPDEELVENLSVNCTTPTLLVKRFAPAMTRRGRGGVVLVSSTAALQGTKVFAAYGAAKAYELILAEGLWAELRERGVDAFGYVVGATATPNFIRNTASSRPDPALLARLAAESGQPVGAPRSPESVAAAMFRILDQREAAPIEPRHWSHPDDAAYAAANEKRPRSEVVEAMGRMTEAVFG